MGDLVDGKTNGEESGPLLTLHPSALLHQSHNQSAGLPPSLRVVVLLVQLQTILRVGPERVWKIKRESRNLQTAVRRNRSIHQWERFRPTWVVSAAPCRVASHPATLVDGHRPTVPLVPLQRVGRQVTHLQLCEIPLEVTEWHPGRMSDDEVAIFAGVIWKKKLRWFYVPELTWLHSLFL